MSRKNINEDELKVNKEFNEKKFDINNNKSLLKLILVGIIIVVSLFAFVIYPKHLKSATPEDTISKIQRSFDRLDFETILDLTLLSDFDKKSIKSSIDLFKSKINDENIDKSEKEKIKLIKNLELKLSNVVIDNNKATAFLELDFGDKDINKITNVFDKKFDVSFIKRNNIWLIDDSTSNLIFKSIEKIIINSL